MALRPTRPGDSLANDAVFGQKARGISAWKPAAQIESSPTAETARIHRSVKGSVTLTGTISGHTIIMYHIKPAEDQ